MTCVGGVVVFDYQSWISQYPEFVGSVSAPKAQSYFNRIAAAFVDNTPSSPIRDLTNRETLLYLAVSHFAFLFASINGQPPRGSNIVGRLSSATEGSVSADFEYVTPTTATEAFWNQSEYGAAYWIGTLSFRTAFYVPAPAYGGGVPGIPYFPGQSFLGARRRW